MKLKTRIRINDIWNDVCKEFDDKSTEFCLSLTAERAGVEYGTVVDALWQSEKEGLTDA